MSMHRHVTSARALVAVVVAAADQGVEGILTAPRAVLLPIPVLLLPQRL